MSETSLLEQFARGIDMVFSDEHPARQNADRAFKDAHVLIEHDMRNLGAVKQSLDGRDENGIIGTDDLSQRAFLP